MCVNREEEEERKRRERERERERERGEREYQSGHNFSTGYMHSLKVLIM